MARRQNPSTLKGGPLEEGVGPSLQLAEEQQQVAPHIDWLMKLRNDRMNSCRERACRVSLRLCSREGKYGRA